jgi:hypothetical protein
MIASSPARRLRSYQSTTVQTRAGAKGHDTGRELPADDVADAARSTERRALAGARDPCSSTRSEIVASPHRARSRSDTTRSAYFDG